MRVKMLFSRKEIDLLKRDISDPKAAERNIEMLLSVFESEPRLRSIVPDPETMWELIAEIEKRRESSTSLMTQDQSVQNERSKLVKETARLYEPNRLIQIFQALAKQTKIKKYKRLFLWCMSELAASLQQDQSLDNSAVMEGIARFAVLRSARLYELMQKFYTGNEPFHFSVEKVVNDEFSDDDIDSILKPFGSSVGFFLNRIDNDANAYLTQIKKPFGLRYFYILQYPWLVHPESIKRFSKDGEEPPLRAIMAAGLQISFNAGLLDLAYKTFIKDFESAIVDILSEVDSKFAMNTIALITRIPAPELTFWQELFRRSGEQAEEINPPDELSAIREIQAKPYELEPYRQYADLLYEKGERFGAYCAYIQMREVMPNEEDDEDVKMSDEILSRLRNLERQLIEENLLPANRARYLEDQDLTEIEKARETANASG